MRAAVPVWRAELLRFTLLKADSSLGLCKMLFLHLLPMCLDPRIRGLEKHPWHPCMAKDPTPGHTDLRLWRKKFINVGSVEKTPLKNIQ